MKSSPAFPMVLHADPEHTGLRAVILLALFVSFVLGYLGISSLLQVATGRTPDYTFAVSCSGGILFGLLVVWVLEKVLKRTWHSGQRVVLDEQGIRAQNRVEKDVVLNWSKNMSRLEWFFKLAGYPRGGRERRVPAGWLCLASQVQEGEERVIVYTYMSPKKATTLLDQESSLFHQIDPLEVYDTTLRSQFNPPMRPEIPSSVLAGKDGRYWLAEKRRWQEGYELPAEDFETFIQVVQSHT